MIREIYIDLDDVLNVFSNYALTFMGCEVPAYNKWPSVNFDVVENYARFKNGAAITPTEFWQAIPEHLWATVPKSPECDLFVALATNLVGMDNVFIATSPVMDGGCHAGKWTWINDNLPSYLRRQYFITPRKVKLGAPGRLLIDDNEDNCQGFEELGGTAILVPRPWNKNHGQPVGPYVMDRLQTIFYGE